MTCSLPTDGKDCHSSHSISSSLPTSQSGHALSASNSSYSSSPSRSTSASNTLGPTLLAIGVILIISKTHATRARARLEKQRLSAINYKAQAKTLRSFLFHKDYNPSRCWTENRQSINRISHSNGARAANRNETKSANSSKRPSLPGGLKERMDKEWEHQPSARDSVRDFFNPVAKNEKGRNGMERDMLPKKIEKDPSPQTSSTPKDQTDCSSHSSKLTLPPEDWGDWIMASPYRPSKSKRSNPTAALQSETTGSPSKGQSSFSTPSSRQDQDAGELGQGQSFRSHYPTRSASASPSLSLGSGEVPSRSLSTPEPPAPSMLKNSLSAARDGNLKPVIPSEESHAQPERLRRVVEEGAENLKKLIETEVVKRLENLLVSLNSATASAQTKRTDFNNVMSEALPSSNVISENVLPSAPTSSGDSPTQGSSSSMPESDRFRIECLASTLKELENRIEALEIQSASSFDPSNSSSASWESSISGSRPGESLQVRLAQVEEELKFTKERALMLGLWADEMGRKFKPPFNQARDSA